LSQAVWRIGTDTPAYEADDLSGAGARATGGRSNAAGVAVVYASRTRALACLETVVHLNAGGLPLGEVRPGDEPETGGLGKPPAGEAIPDAAERRAPQVARPAGHDLDVELPRVNRRGGMDPRRQGTVRCKPLASIDPEESLGGHAAVRGTGPTPIHGAQRLVAKRR
jgi:hypothetical protein